MDIFNWKEKVTSTRVLAAALLLGGVWQTGIWATFRAVMANFSSKNCVYPAIETPCMWHWFCIITSCSCSPACCHPSMADNGTHSRLTHPGNFPWNSASEEISVNRNKCQTPSETQTDRHQKSSLVHFSLKMWHMVTVILMIFLTKFRVLIGWSRIFIPAPLNFCKASRFVGMDAPDRHNGQMDVSLSFCPFVS